MNQTLLAAFEQQDMDTIVTELTPLFYKYMKGVPDSCREDLFQELVLTCMQVVEGYDFSQQHTVI